MQGITVICVGKCTSEIAKPLAEYEKRLGPLCRFRAMELPEETLDEKSVSPAGIAAALEKEGGRILAVLPKRAIVFALCVEGKQLYSEAFAARLEEAALRGQSEAAFVIGSSHGLADAVKQRADVMLSLSAMTLPHQLARLVLTEQVYRAMMIRSGSKYHK